MKEYDREQRKWVGVDEKSPTKKKDPKVCFGKKPHDYVLVLPYGVSYDETYKFNPEKVYEILDAEVQFYKQQREFLAAMGVRARYFVGRQTTRVYRCAKCKKAKYEYPSV